MEISCESVDQTMTTEQSGFLAGIASLHPRTVSPNLPGCNAYSSSRDVELFSSFELDGSGLVRVSVGTFREVTAFDNSRRKPPFLIQVLCTEHHARLKQSPRRSSQYHPLWSQPENSSQPCKLLSPALQSFSQSLSIVLLLISSSNLRSPFSASGSERF